MTTVTKYIYSLLHGGELTYAKLLRARFVRKLDARIGYQAGAPTMPILPNPNAHDQKWVFVVIQGLVKLIECWFFCRKHNIFNVSSKALAEQMTDRDSKMFTKIDLAELLRWSEKQDAKTAPNLVRKFHDFM